jgi:hypothetical protein
MPADEVEGFGELRVQRRLAASERYVMVAERVGFTQDFVERFQRQKQFAFIAFAAIDVAEAVRAIKVADVVQFDSETWHNSADCSARAPLRPLG